LWAQRTLFEHSRKRFSVIVGYYDGRIPFSNWITRINLLCERLFAGSVGVDRIALLMLASNVERIVQVDLRTFLISQSIWFTAHF
jgi:hypothetical protein